MDVSAMKDVISLTNCICRIGLVVLILASLVKVVIMLCGWARTGWRGSLLKAGRELAVVLVVSILALVISTLCSFVDLDALRECTADPLHSFVCGLPISSSVSRQAGRFAVLGCRLQSIILNHFCWLVVLTWLLGLKSHRNLWRRVALSVSVTFLIYSALVLVFTVPFILTSA